MCPTPKPKILSVRVMEHPRYMGTDPRRLTFIMTSLKYSHGFDLTMSVTQRIVHPTYIYQSCFLLTLTSLLGSNVASGESISFLCLLPQLQNHESKFFSTHLKSRSGKSDELCDPPRKYNLRIHSSQGPASTGWPLLCPGERVCP